MVRCPSPFSRKTLTTAYSSAPRELRAPRASDGPVDAYDANPQLLERDPGSETALDLGRPRRLVEHQVDQPSQHAQVVRRRRSPSGTNPGEASVPCQRAGRIAAEQPVVGGAQGGVAPLAPRVQLGPLHVQVVLRHGAARHQRLDQEHHLLVSSPAQRLKPRSQRLQRGRARLQRLEASVLRHPLHQCPRRAGLDLRRHELGAELL
eukprot:3366199-Pyramimonas_sp.AAC.1